ncbi:MAG: OmpH family outer membrane protein [Candidatus Kapabacteria bacterium]|nr:OmpH family outer membrane protein [Candidatus Kapabacteria bacterium]
MNKIPKFRNVALFVLMLIASANVALAQRVAFINSNTIREKFPEGQQAQQRVQSMIDEWKRELDAMQQKIDNLDFEIKKNRLIWTEDERRTKESELASHKRVREDYAKTVFEQNGKHDQATKTIYTPVEEKIYAAVQKVAADQGFDIILDQSIQPLPYVNYKFDLTVNVLRELGVDVGELEKDLQDRIEKDPRNEQKISRTPRQRGRGDYDPNAPPTTDRQFEQETEQDKENPKQPRERPVEMSRPR